MKNRGFVRQTSAFIIFLLCLVKSAFAFQLTVQAPDGTPVAGYRWLVEEDTSHPVTPGAIVADSLSVSLHSSYAPVVTTGHTTVATTTINIPTDKRYVVSVLPDHGASGPRYSLGGGNVAIGQDQLTVTVQSAPLPTAQISIVTFHDNHPLNNAMDATEQLLSGFTILIDDTIGPVSQDVFGNPLGTTYQQNPDGSFVLDASGQPVVAVMGTGIITTGTCPGADCGRALIKYLAPGKYGVQAIPPVGQNWQQTNTLEGTHTIDAWVKAKEPPFFTEFGPPGPHVAFGFIQPMSLPVPAPGTDVGTIAGRIINRHISRAPVVSVFPGEPVSNCWIGLNTQGVAAGQAVYAQPCNADSTFTIPDVPPGAYTLVVFDEFLDLIIARMPVTVPAGGAAVDLGDVSVNNWYAKEEHFIFFDDDQDGFPDPGEVGIGSQTVNLRYRDGSIYQSTVTAPDGVASFDQVFPFFRFLIAEVDYARFKATGTTVVVDAGGPIPPDAGWAMPSRNALNPQAQCVPNLDPADSTSDANGVYGDCIDQINPNTGNHFSRTETGVVLTQAVQSFLGMTNVINWGKANYASGENGGITGIVYYATTRAENDPRNAVGDPWEPGIPRVQVNLYQDWNDDHVIDDLDGDGLVTLADVDNYPFGWRDGGTKGAEDVDRNINGLFDAGDAIQVATTDSWDDNLPTGCPPNPGVPAGSQAPFYVNGDPATPAQDCFEGFRTYNQVRDGVFDGGYVFDSYHPGGIDSGSTVVTGLPSDKDYIVEAVSPPGYELVKEEDKNVDYGDSYVPSPLTLPPVCVGDPHTVPPTLSLFNDIAAPFATESRPLCDRKQIRVADRKNAAVDFFMFTYVPKAARFVGGILNDLANEFDPNAPAFGEKVAVPWVPVSVRDWTGREISRVYSDQWGGYNGMVPSTYTVNVPAPSGVSENMLTVCLNNPGPIANPAYVPGGTEPEFIMDPHFKPQYSQFCYTFEYLPGKTRYLDTPVLPIAAFAGAGAFPVDCEYIDGTPVIYSVSGPAGGPYVSSVGEVIQITAAGPQEVANPAFDPASGAPKTISRDFGFGTVKGTVTIGNVVVPDADVTWSDGVIEVVVPAGVGVGEYQLSVRRGDNGLATPMGITLTVDDGAGPGGPDYVIHVPPGGSIQATIDFVTGIVPAPTNALVLVPPGNYNELVVVPRNIKLQGWGAPSTIINAFKNPAEKLLNWRTKVQGLVDSGAVDLLPGQLIAAGGAGGLEPALFVTEEGPGIIVLAKDGDFAAPPNNARIDGFTITGADYGGGIFVNGYARYLEISNNRLINNLGSYGGGIRIGHPLLGVSGNNSDINIHHNQIGQNGAVGNAGGDAGGGGIALYQGSDRYRVTDNMICGNFAAANGGGINHFGLSQDGNISYNRILFNQTFNQGVDVSGGGIFVGGLAAGGDGSGSVTIEGNLIQGNHAGAGDGGGIRTQFINGADVAAAPTDPAGWYEMEILNNFIVNNVAGHAGGGVSMQDTAKAVIISNTVVNNDSTATTGTSFTPGVPNHSNPQVAGIVSYVHSAALAGLVGPGSGPEFSGFSNPLLVNDIVWHNRSFYWVADDTVTPPFKFLPDVTTSPPDFRDLAVVGTLTAQQMNPQYSVLSSLTGFDGAVYDPATNKTGDPLFIAEYYNGARSGLLLPEVTTGLGGAPAPDEGGNAIDVQYGPLTLIDTTTGLPFGDYHLQGASPAKDVGTGIYVAGYPYLGSDVDEEPRPLGAVDIGADEIDPLGDSDGDGVADYLDNCIYVANASQLDVGGDGYGNACDTDLTDDHITSLADFGMFRAAFGSFGPNAADFTGDGVVSLADFGVFRVNFGKIPGPSGTTP